MTEKPYKISKDRPPNWDKIVEVFNPEWNRVAVAYGDTVHAANLLPEDILHHELVHLRQQEYSKEKAVEWWDRYIADKHFRYGQEAEAYREQYKYLKEKIKDRNLLARHANLLAEKLSSELYGSIVSHREALKIITKRQ